MSHWKDNLIIFPTSLRTPWLNVGCDMSISFKVDFSWILNWTRIELWIGLVAWLSHVNSAIWTSLELSPYASWSSPHIHEITTQFIIFFIIFSGTLLLIACWNILRSHELIILPPLKKRHPQHGFVIMWPSSPLTKFLPSIFIWHGAIGTMLFSSSSIFTPKHNVLNWIWIGLIEFIAIVIIIYSPPLGNTS
jgi:hypothetical protein